MRIQRQNIEKQALGGYGGLFSKSLSLQTAGRHFVCVSKIIVHLLGVFALNAATGAAFVAIHRMQKQSNNVTT